MMRTYYLLCGLSIAACAHARTADEYRDATAAALSAHTGDIKGCYDQVLATKPSATGRVTVRFGVEEKTGKLTDAKLDNSQTTAPDEVSKCVLAAIPAAAIEPADRKRGEATWTWDFTAGAAPTTTPAPN